MNNVTLFVTFVHEKNIFSHTINYLKQIVILMLDIVYSSGQILAKILYNHLS